jgi:hypothetical protein
MFGSESLQAALDALGALLSDREQSYELVAIGGGSLLLLGLIERPTRDLDLVAIVVGDSYISAEPLPGPLADAARDVAHLFQLPADWLNAGPTMQLRAGLPPGFPQRTVRRQMGGLVLNVASRLDQIHLKLFAAVDTGPTSKHVADLRRLSPSGAELDDAACWVKTQDAAAEFPDLVDQVVAAIRGSDGG